MKKKSYLILLVCLNFLLTGCKVDATPYTIPFEYEASTSYSAQKIGKYLGKLDNILENIHELKGLPPDEYLYLSASTIIGGGKADAFLISKKAQEPLLIYDINKISLTFTEKHSNKSKTISIKDKDTIAALLTLRKNDAGKGEEGAPIQGEWADARFYFDLPCKLIYSSAFIITSDQKVFWKYETVVGHETRKADITDILTEELLAEIITAASLQFATK